MDYVFLKYGGFRFFIWDIRVLKVSVLRGLVISWVVFDDLV